MKLGQKVSGVFGSKVVSGTVYDFNNTTVWIETTEDIYTVKIDTVTIQTAKKTPARFTKEYSTEEYYRGEKMGWVNRKTGIFVRLICKNESDFYAVVKKLESNGLNVNMSGCPVDEENEYSDIIATFDIEDEADVKKYMNDCKKLF